MDEASELERITFRGTEGESLSLVILECLGHTLPTPGDVHLLLEVRCADFAGVARPWVEQQVWEGFLQSLLDLELKRTGEARFESMSPGEARVRFASGPRALTVEGRLAVAGKGAVEFVFVLDSELIGAAVHKLAVATGPNP